MAKKGIHPQYNPVVISCSSCSTIYHTRSTLTSNMSVEICANCHPYYTGQQRLVDTEGRVDRFNKKYARGGAGAVQQRGVKKL